MSRRGDRLFGLQDTQSCILQAFTQEVNVFLHCHLRGYDLTGCGVQMNGGYFDKYGAPLDMYKSWSEGYRDIENKLAEHFDDCKNPLNELPMIAGYGGGVHLYKPIENHDTEPWNITGWVPLENVWCCEKNFFKNRYFFCLRGNEIQNDMWNYHPYMEDWTQDNADSCYEQYVPLDTYKGGYWYENDVRGRYLHIITLKTQSYNDEGNYDRYNFIVHPLAYRKNISLLPDNSVDGMQWCITNIVNEPNFNNPKTWGDKCHGLEIFNDFTYFHSWQPNHQGIYNGTKMNYSEERKKTRYHYWFQTYPLEFGEFLLDSALTMGTYLHPIAANDAFFSRKIVAFDDLSPEEQAEAEGMERVLNADPKGALVQRLKDMVNQKGCSKEAAMRRSALKKFDGSSASKKSLLQSIAFRAEKPYGEDTIFGYVAVLDYKMELKECMEKNPPPNLYKKGSKPDSGLNVIEPDVIKKLRGGQFYSHTGVYDMFIYNDQNPIPFTIAGQTDTTILCSELTAGNECKFTFPRAKVKTCPIRGVPKNPLHWRYMIQTVDRGEDERSVVTTYGYFVMNTEYSTLLDLSNYSTEDVCWIRFAAIDPLNPQKRAWYPPVRGPAFAKSADKIIDIAGDLPRIRERIVTTEVGDPEFTTTGWCGLVKEVGEFVPSVIDTPDLDLVFNTCSYTEQDDVYAYCFQAYPVKQPIDKNSCYLRASKVSEDDPDVAFAPRIMESVHGYFQLCEEYPSRFNLTESWDKTSVVNQQVSVYALDSMTAQPKDIKHLILKKLPDFCLTDVVADLIMNKV